MLITITETKQLSARGLYLVGYLKLRENVSETSSLRVGSC